MPDENKVQDDTVLKEGEPHPSAHAAYLWFHQSVVDDPIRYIHLKEAISSTALSGNRLAQICYGTMNRLEEGQPVSDRYLLGLVWYMRDLYDRVKSVPAPKTEATSPVATKKRSKPAKKAKK